MMWIVFAVLCLATGALAGKEFIIGGSPADISNHPWQGSYRNSSGHHVCGCVFVGSRFAITAAHCGGSSSYTVEFGTSIIGLGIVFDVFDVTPHPLFEDGPGFLPNDISVIETAFAISGPNISPATILENNVNRGGQGIITGWGKMCGGSGCDTETYLRQAEIPIILDDVCEREWNDNFQSDNMICVWGDYSGTTGFCDGDEGGPLIDLQEINTVIGVASWTRHECNTSSPSVYAKVATFYDWICQETYGMATGC